MSKKKKSVSDFRYDSGKTLIPWNAVGEPVIEKDVVDIIKFLIQPAKGHSNDYKIQMSKVKRELAKLNSIGRHAGKLTLGNYVQSLEAKFAKFLNSKYTQFVASSCCGRINALIG
jgi:hypothetical protein